MFTLSLSVPFSCSVYFSKVSGDTEDLKKTTHIPCQLATQRTKVKHWVLKVHLTEGEIFSLIGRTVGSHWSSESYTSGKKKKKITRPTPVRCCFHSNRSITATQQLIRISMNFKCSPRGAYIGCRLNRNIDRPGGTASKPSFLAWCFGHIFVVFLLHIKHLISRMRGLEICIFIRMEKATCY